MRQSTARFVVLLRGVNVGKNKRVPMAAFKALLEGLGYADVRTLLNSGNAVFGSAEGAAAKHADAIAAALRDQLGVDVLVVVKTARDFLAALDGLPFVPPEGEHARVLVAWTQSPEALRALKPCVDLAQPPERFAVEAHAAYLHCPNGILASEVGSALLGKSGAAVTTRNWATAVKLGALLESGAA